MSESQDHTPVLELIQQLHSGQLSPQTLSPDTRRDVVEVLLAENYRPEQIAVILKRADRTIRRDLEVIRERNALRPNEEFGPELAGQLVADAERAITRLKRLASDESLTPTERSQAEYKAWKIRNELTQRLGVLGYVGGDQSPARPTTSRRPVKGPSLEDMLQFAQRRYEIIGKPPVNLRKSTGPPPNEPIPQGEQDEWRKQLLLLDIFTIRVCIAHRRLLELGFDLLKQRALRDGISPEDFARCIKRVGRDIFDPDYDRKLAAEMEEAGVYPYGRR